jgi:hypothetical protein
MADGLKQDTDEVGEPGEWFVSMPKFEKHSFLTLNE